MGRHAEAGNVDADDAYAVDLLGQEAQRNARRGRHAEIDDDDRVVLVRVGELEDRVADVLEELAGDQRFGIERHVADGALGPVKVRREGQAVDAAGRAAEHARRPAHAKPDPQRAEGRAHALRLVVRADGIVARVALERLVHAGGFGGLAELLFSRMATRAFGARDRSRRRVDLARAFEGGPRRFRWLGQCHGVSSAVRRCRRRLREKASSLARPRTCPPSWPARERRGVRPPRP